MGIHRRQISDLLDQSIQVNAQCFVITADNRFILLCGFWDKSFRIYSTDTGNCNDPPQPPLCLRRHRLHHSTQRKGSKVTNEPADCITTPSPWGSDSFLISRMVHDSIQDEAQNASHASGTWISIESHHTQTLPSSEIYSHKHIQSEFFFSWKIDRLCSDKADFYFLFQKLLFRQTWYTINCKGSNTICVSRCNQSICMVLLVTM